MAEPKTKPTGASVADFIAALPDAGRCADAETLCAMLQEITGQPPVMWGPTIVGFGRYTNITVSQKPADWPIAGFSPRKTGPVVYLVPGFGERTGLLERLGKHSTGVSCLYLKRLSDVDMGVLRELCEWSVAEMRARYPA